MCCGSCSQYLNGEGRELVLQAGDACILTPGIIHAVLPCTPENLVLKLVIPAGHMKRILAGMQRAESAKSEGGVQFQDIQGLTGSDIQDSAAQEQERGGSGQTEPEKGRFAELLRKQNEALDSISQKERF